MRYGAVLIPGDGIGPEIVDVAVATIKAAEVEIDWDLRLAGHAAVAAQGQPAPPDTLSAIAEKRVCLKGPFFTPAGGSLRSANYYIRHELDLFACVRRIVDPTSGVDLVLVRENLEDLYGAIECTSTPDVALAIKVATRAGSERVAELAVGLAINEKRRRVTVVHKANNLKRTEGLFLEAAFSVANGLDVEMEEMIADTACSSMVLEPERFDVVLAGNTLGDLLSNIGSAVVGSLGLVASANYGAGVAVFEAAHGSADVLAGVGTANPIGMVRAGALLLDHLGEGKAAKRIEDAVVASLRAGIMTPDLGGSSTSAAVGDFLVDTIKSARA